jgi:hypothetical protein
LNAVVASPMAVIGSINHLPFPIDKLRTPSRSTVVFIR